MGAKIGMEVDVARLVELADQIGQREQRPLHRRGIAGIGPEVAVALFVGRKQRRAAGKVEDQVTFADDAITRSVEGESPARRDGHRRMAVDLEREGAEMAPRVR